MTEFAKRQEKLFMFGHVASKQLNIDSPPAQRGEKGVDDIYTEPCAFDVVTGTVVENVLVVGIHELPVLSRVL